MYYKDVNINGINFRIKMANDKKHKYISWLISKTDDQDKIILSRPVKFGAYGMEHYKDKIGYYNKFDHNDKKRLENFQKRFGTSYKNYVEKYKDDTIKMTKSPLFWSWNYLW